VGARRLSLFRHGHAESPDAWAEDFERPLTRRGAEETREMARRLKRSNRVPNVILVSPAERTWSTALIIAEVCELDQQQIHCERELYLATPDAIWQVVSRQKQKYPHILLCGHNPSLSALASRFGPKQKKRELPPAGIASAVWTEGNWDSLSPRSAASCELDDAEAADD
jgi:phosphohistidine phosphatase